jgi:hypothetical protein
MSNLNESVGQALGSSLVIGPLLVTLVSRGILSDTDASVVIDSALTTLNELEAVDEPEHFEMWEKARAYIGSLRNAVGP